MNLFYVYAHINPLTGSVFYIGRGTEGRAYSHSGRSLNWKRYVRKLISDGSTFEVKILHSCLNNSDSILKEAHEIRKHLEQGVELTNISIPREQLTTSVRASIDLLEIAHFVKTKRKGVRLSQKDFARKAGVGLRFIRELESGSKNSMNIGLVNRVIKMFGYKLLPARDTGL